MIMKPTDFTDRELVKTGRLKKPVAKMTDAEFKEWQGWSAKEVRKKLFAIGQPLVYQNEQGRYVAEHSDGRVETID